jgi:hypothetical protein
LQTIVLRFIFVNRFFIPNLRTLPFPLLINTQCGETKRDAHREETYLEYGLNACGHVGGNVLCRSAIIGRTRSSEDDSARCASKARSFMLAKAINQATPHTSADR